MENSIRDFPKQFGFQPIIENQNKLKRLKNFIFVGMGGSHLAADIVKLVKPSLPGLIHKDYGLPSLPEKELKNSLIVTVSFSGNTEETLDAFQKAIEKKLNVVAVSKGGKLLELAKKFSLPYVQLPDVDIQPRMSLGYIFRALLKIIGEEALFKESERLVNSLRAQDYFSAGQQLAEKIKGYIPIIYSACANEAVAYNWKIKLNETAKTPAFSNVFPELNHNEMTGIAEAAKEIEWLTKKFFFIFLRFEGDHPRIIKRMDLLERIYKERGFQVESLEFVGGSLLERIFTAIILADWTALSLAKFYEADPEQVLLNEKFKKELQSLD